MMKHLVFATVLMISAASLAAPRFGDVAETKSLTLEALEEMAFDDRLSMEARWTATTRLGKQFGDKAKAQMERAMKSPEWFMRNAALVVLHYGQRDWAIQWSQKLLDDPALVVRTAAVHTLQQLRAVESEELLWKKLESKENYRGGQSLWVRHHIVKALGDFAAEGSERRFAPLLSDRDPLIRKAAMRTLAKLTKLDFNTEHEWRNYLAQREL